MTEHRRCPACGKRVHTSPKAARRANKARGGKVIVYRCAEPGGTGWHVAQRSKRSPAQLQSHHKRRH